MATYKGTQGIVSFEYQGWSPDGQLIQTEVQSFTLTEAAAIISDNSLADEWDTHLVGRKAWTGTIVSNFDMTQQIFDLPLLEDPTSQVGPLYLGQQLAIELFPVGDDQGGPPTPTVWIKIAGVVTVTGYETSNSHDNAVLTMTLSVTGTGEMLQTYEI
jgi:hypothetical protein